MVNQAFSASAQDGFVADRFRESAPPSPEFAPMKLFTLAIALLALALPLSLVFLHPSTGGAIDWDGGGVRSTVGHVAAQHLASR